MYLRVDWNMVIMSPNKIYYKNIAFGSLIFMDQENLGETISAIFRVRHFIRDTNAVSIVKFYCLQLSMFSMHVSIVKVYCLQLNFSIEKNNNLNGSPGRGFLLTGKLATWCSETKTLF